MSFCLGIGTQHADAGLTEVGNTFEDRTGGQVATCVQDAAIFIYALYVDAQLLFKTSIFSSMVRGFARKNQGAPKVARPTMTASTP